VISSRRFPPPWVVEETAVLLSKGSVYPCRASMSRRRLDPLALRAGDLGLPTPAGVSLSSQVCVALARLAVAGQSGLTIQSRDDDAAFVRYDAA
jgi:hypothetical protein